MLAYKKHLKNYSFFFVVVGIYSPTVSQEMNGSTSDRIQATAFVSAPVGLVKLSEFEDENKISEFEKLSHKITVNISEDHNQPPIEILIYHPPYYNNFYQNSSLQYSGTDFTIFSYSKCLPFVKTEFIDNQLIATLIYTEN